MPTLELTTTIGCSLNCTVCPQSNFVKNYKSNIRKLTLVNLKTVLSKVPKNVRIDFSGFSEPFLNKECISMIEYALSENFDITVYSTLYGMSVSDSEKLVSLIEKYTNKIKNFCIHLPDNLNNMPGWKHSTEYEQVLKNLIGLKNEIKTQIRFFVLTMGSLHPLLKDIQFNNSGYKEYWNDWKGHTRAGNITVNDNTKDLIHDTPKNDFPVSCASTPFYDHNVMLPNGDVVLCCMDFGLKHIIGNLLSGSYEDLYLSDEMVNIMKTNKRSCFSDKSLCKTCTNVTSYKINNDNHWESTPYSFYKKL